MAETSAQFEAHRAHLTALAYRMLGSMSDAEDIVQNAYLRWRRTNRADVANAEAFLTKTVSRLCLDELRSARRRREIYVGPWLPEPLVELAGFTDEAEGDHADDLSIGLMLTLERLTPLERAAFLLHDVFGVDYSEIAPLIGRTEATSRQLATRARRHVRESRPRSEVSRGDEGKLLDAFLAAAREGNVATLKALLADDVRLASDGGGKSSAARNVLHGPDRVARFLVGIHRKYRNAATVAAIRARVNGAPGVVTQFEDGLLDTLCIETRDGAVVAVFITRNPDKLKHVAAALSALRDGGSSSSPTRH